MSRTIERINRRAGTYPLRYDKCAERKFSFVEHTDASPPIGRTLPRRIKFMIKVHEHAPKPAINASPTGRFYHDGK